MEDRNGVAGARPELRYLRRRRRRKGGSGCTDKGEEGLVFWAPLIEGERGVGGSGEMGWSLDEAPTWFARVGETQERLGWMGSIQRGERRGEGGRVPSAEMRGDGEREKTSLVGTPASSPELEKKWGVGFVQNERKRRRSLGSPVEGT